MKLPAVLLRWSDRLLTYASAWLGCGCEAVGPS